MPAVPNQVAPNLSLATVNAGTIDLSQQQEPEKYTVVIFYRGNHCPICISHLAEVEQNYKKFQDAGMNLVAVSMDTFERAQLTHDRVAKTLEKDTLQLPIAYGLTQEQASKDWGLYLSPKIEGSSEPDIFSEPGLFVLRPDTTIFMANKQSAPFTRPSMEQLLGGLLYAYQHDYPARGTYELGQ